jgi:flagellar assembly factor FliW
MEMKIVTSRFGEIEVDDRSVVHMPEGMLGFSEFKDYVLIKHNDGSPFLWYQAVAEPSLAFVVVDPFTFFPDYEVLLSGEDMELLKCKTMNNLAVFSVVVIPENPERMTANLRGPIVINTQGRLARQVVLTDERYSPNQSIMEELERRIDEQPARS